VRRVGEEGEEGREGGREGGREERTTDSAGDLHGVSFGHVRRVREEAGEEELDQVVGPAVGQDLG